MEKDFGKILTFFQNRLESKPGDYDYDAAFCRVLTEAAVAKDASVWKLDSDRSLHMVYGTDIPHEELSSIRLLEGEGISGAAVLSRQPVLVSDVLSHPRHNHHVDAQLGRATRAMISAPIIFRDIVYGVINVLDPVHEKSFTSDWKDYLAAAATIYAAALDLAGRLAIPFEGRFSNASGNNQSKKIKNKTVIIGISRSIQEALDLCLKTGRMDIPVLVCGETGSGKELAARRIHESGNRSKGPFIAVNCAAIPETLLESELFGHVKGAFSGANQNRQGKFVAASGGTLFLDEIGDMSPACQAKILRTLEEKKVMPVGSDESRTCDTRVIAATNFNLLEQVRKGNFREDLYYRLCGIEIDMPPLRERMEDLVPLAAYFMQRISDAQKRNGFGSFLKRLSSATIQMLHTYSWPGNVRQLEQAISASAAICEGDVIQPVDLPKWLRDAIRADHDPRNTNFIPAPGFPLEGIPIKNSGFFDMDRMRYLETLEKTKYPRTGRYNMAAAAAELDIPRKTFTYRLKKMGIIQ